MSGFFGNFGRGAAMDRQTLEGKYNSARINLLIVVAFTAINIITLVTNMGSYFLFSANIPYVLTLYGMLFCGMFPKEYYVEAELEGMVFFDKSFFVILLVISILILALYLICWLLSKNGKVVWLKVALGFFIADTLLMFVLGSAGSPILDAVFHFWVIYILVSGIKAHKKLAEMPQSEVMIEAEYTEIENSGDGEDVSEASETVMEIEAPVEEAVNDNGTTSEEE